MVGISGNAVRQREAKALRKLRKKFNDNKNVLVQGENIQEINRELEKISEEEKEIYNFEKLWIYFQENDGKDNVNLEELGIHMSEKMQKLLDIEDTSEADLKRIESMNEYYIQNTLDNYYENLSNTIQKKEMLEQKKERHKEFMSIYEPAEREYLNNEDIFNPEYTIKGVKIREVKEIKDIPKKKSIYNLGLHTSVLVYLHHSGISTIQDILSKAENLEQLKEYLNSIKGLNEHGKEMITEYIIDNKYFNKGKLNNDEDINSKLSTNIEKLNFGIRTYNCLKRAGINLLGDLADMTEEQFRKVRLLREKNIEEVVAKMQEFGISFKTKEQLEEERIEKHEKEQQEYREARKRSFQEKNVEPNRPKTDLEIALERRFRELFEEDKKQQLEDMTPEQLQDQIKINEDIIAENEEEIKDTLTEVVLSQQNRIRAQENEIADLKSQRRDIDG